MQKHKGKALFDNHKGTSIVLVALFLTVLLLIAALVLDFGRAYIDKSKLSAGADAAALAGAQRLTEGAVSARAEAVSYAAKNDIDTYISTPVVVDGGKSIEVTAEKEVQTYFAKLAGYGMLPVKVKAKAVIGAIVGIRGARPFAVEAVSIEYGTQITLREGAGSGVRGYYGFLDYGPRGGGARNLREDILDGYDGLLKVGDEVETKTGVNNSTLSAVDDLIDECNHTPLCTFSSYHPDCPRIIVVPVVEFIDHNTVRIKGFATFFLEGYTNHGGHAEIKGRFIEYRTAGEIDPYASGYGLRGVKLVK